MTLLLQITDTKSFIIINNNNKKLLLFILLLLVNRENQKYNKNFLDLNQSGNTYFMDGAGNITVTAPKNMTFNAGENINITAGKEISIGAGASITSSANDNITSTAGTDIVQTAAGDIRESSDTRTEMVEKEFFRQSETSNEIAGEISMFSE